MLSRSNPIGRARHDLGRVPHERAYRRRQVHAAGSPGVGAVRRLVCAHLMHYGTAVRVGRRQATEMLIEVAFDLPLRLDHETEAGAVAGDSGERADEKRAGVPEWVEQARTGVELFQAALAPSEVIGLLACGIEQELASGLGASGHRLTMIKSLGGNLPGMVDAHQGRGPALFIG